MQAQKLVFIAASRAMKRGLAAKAEREAVDLLEMEEALLEDDLVEEPCVLE